ncbi:MAG: carbohydrate kinase family protein [Candidatus Levybacteria bacterium]|nr:carbohydrate kinase family protein [Candidatus Levybacteria bacterium]
MDVFDVVAVGNAKIDIFLQVHDTNQHFKLNPQTKELCVISGDKALVDKAFFTIGGNAANVSVGLSRMGLKTAIVAEIGSDEFADKIKNTLKKENVSEDYLKQAEGESSLSVIINYAKERTIFEENVEREHDYNFDNISGKWIYLTSIGKKWENAYRKTLDFVEKNNLKLAFNPGTAQLDDGLSEIAGIFKKTEILFLSKEEAIKILKLDSSSFTSDEESIKKLLFLLKELGPKVAIITDGKNGSFMLDENNNFFFQGIKEAEVVEKTGAGDAYASGFLSAVIFGQNYQTAMKWGTENSASVIGKVGAQTGLLRRKEMEKT